MKFKATPYALGAVIAAATALMLPSCTSDNKNQEGKDGSITEKKDSIEKNTFYLIPSPQDLFAFAQDNNAQYSADILNPTENKTKYLDNRSKEINFGIYSADMAYSAALGKYQEAVKYLQTVRELSDAIGIANVFTQALVARIDNLSNNTDSLKSISSDTYNDIVKFLANKNREKTTALISAGGWIESLYIVTNTIDKYDEKEPNIQRIADQKLVLENLMLYLNQVNQQKEDAAIAQTIKDFNPLKEAYDQIKYEPSDDAAKTNQESAIVIGGTKKLKMSEENFKKIKETIASVRNNLTSNDVTK